MAQHLARLGQAGMFGSRTAGLVFEDLPTDHKAQARDDPGALDSAHAAADQTQGFSAL